MTVQFKKPNHTRRIALTLLAFLLLEIAVYLFVDRAVAEYVKGLNQTAPGVIDFFRGITDLGKSQWYLIVCGLAALFCGFLSRGKDVRQVYRRLCAYIGVRAFVLFATIGLSGIAADILKPVLGRARPKLWFSDQIYGFMPFTAQGFAWNGMPSGHTATAFALACSLSLFYRRARPLWFAYALLLAASRVMVDAHYLSDVVAGAAVGWLTVRLFIQHGMIRIWKVIFPIDIAPSPK